jgi:hypothetical protein
MLLKTGRRRRRRKLCFKFVVYVSGALGVLK